MTDSAPTRKLPPASSLSFVGRLRASALVGLELALILLVVHLFHIEEPTHFFPILCLTAAGFALHAWLPQRWRAAFFALLSLVSILLVLGWPNGAWVIGIGGGLIVLCHLPLPLIVRVLLLVIAGVQLAALRLQFQMPFWPVLASMFMFRLIVYLYETGRQRGRPPLAHTLAYFFPLPNICFTLFPVLDFQTFRASYYDDEDYTIYQSGITFLVRGISHLLLYRVVKYYLLPAPHELTDLPHLLLFLATNYALYLRVSGWFHAITGILHLFGFNLPRTHHNYFLASSVSDVWRRINIYWKDFMAKVFFFPTFFALRGGGTRLALAAASLGVFLATWLLHSYQLFWLRAELPLSESGAALWLTAGVVVTAKLQLDLSAKRREEKTRKQSICTFSLFREALAGAILTLRILSTFLLVSFFWACWTLPHFPSSLYVLATSGAITAAGVLTVLGCVASAVTAGVLVWLARGWLRRRGALPLAPAFPLSAALPAVVLLMLAAAGIPRIGAALGPQMAEMLATLRLEATTPVEAAAAVQGYYEQIADTHVQVSPLLALPGLPEKKRPSPVYMDMSRPTDDFLEYEVIPGWSGEVLGHHLTINSLGMRDREGITQEKPAGVCRLAFVGSSVVMGHGVGDDETFTHLLDAEMNAERLASQERKRPEDGDPRRVEVLNFGMGKSHALHRRTVIARKVLAFNPDALYYVAHQDEYLGTVRHLTRLIDRRNELPAYLREVVQRAGIGPEMPPGQVEIRLQAFAPEIVRRIYADIIQQCRQRGILPVWVYVPVPGIVDARMQSSKLIGLAEEAGFVVLNLAKWADGHAPEEVKLGVHHPNALGHRLIADHLQAALREQPDALPVCARP